MVILGVGNRAHDALADIAGDALAAELELGHGLIDLLAADQTGDEIEFLRRDPETPCNRLRLVVGQAPLVAWLAHYFFTAFLSPPCPWK